MATSDQLNTAFKMAGILTGKPPSSDPIGVEIIPDSQAAVNALFTEQTIKRLQRLAGEQDLTIMNGDVAAVKGFEFLMAALILETLTAANLSLAGRSLDNFNFSMQGINRVFALPSQMQRQTAVKASQLRLKAARIQES